MVIYCFTIYNVYDYCVPKWKINKKKKIRNNLIQKMYCYKIFLNYIYYKNFYVYCKSYINNIIVISFFVSNASYATKHIIIS